MATYEAHFAPEAWQRDQAIPVDPRGPDTWDCTAYARQHVAYLAECARHGGGDSLTDEWGVIDNDDLFMSDPAAPRWVQEWRGPFTIRIRAAGYRTVQNEAELPPGACGYESGWGLPWTEYCAEPAGHEHV